ncbi:WcaF family extracellular polysaccharide biosynthesis acetyltransferase [Flavisolibacter nicotianae]|uniref:WcaF family extracellular polysaccharide biosynthesis acetyltransferase n=1 Tax=Flavisolibacter nicotianae TaxID=2364882 RepID=UPI000EB1954E|nr:WcaF family extracellular polysaccharide biosynthesis acetyltransferase [Flavisolibacter nicotianae]
MRTDLSKYDNSWYNPGPWVTRILWYIVSTVFFRTAFPFTKVKTLLLRLFGAKVGKGVMIKPYVTIKYPWFLTIGNNSWIGERAWIDNLTEVVIGDNVCLSQEAYLLTGNHNYRKPSFDLVVGKIKIEDGVWIGARATVCPGVTCFSHAVLAVGSVATADLEPYSINVGNPATKQKDRIKETPAVNGL